MAKISLSSNRATSLFVISSSALFLLCTSNPVHAANISYNFATLEFPGAFSTSIQGINDTGQTVGVFDATSSSFGIGFVSNGSTFTSISGPGATLGTVANGINASGTVVGQYGTGTIFAPHQHGFQDTGGSIATIDNPNAGALGTVANDINSSGTVVGVYFESGGAQKSFKETSGIFTTIDIAGSTSTAANGINDAGQIVGDFSDGTSGHGFLDNGGSITSFDFAGAADTHAEDINNSGEIVGYIDFNLPSNNFLHGFVDHGGTFQEIDFPGALQTQVFGVNNLGQIVGAYVDDASFPTAMHGFIATPVSTVPLPPALPLFGAAIVGLGYAGRCGRRKKS